MLAEKPSSHFKMDVPPQSPQWSEQIARRITIMSSEQIQSARIQLDPPELGLLEIKIKVQQDQVNVAFASGHQTVRDALETQAPRLKELMEQQGVDLTDVNVSDHGQQSSDGSAEEGLADQGDGQAGDWQGDEELNAQETVALQSDSLVDDFA
jgi:flagellar hook-length control protein FliK